MEDVIKRFDSAKAEFLRSNASEKSIEQLYDIVYYLKDRNKTYQENYILAYIYDIMGETILASEVIELALKTVSTEEETRLKELLDYIEKQDRWSKIRYRDLREAKTIKNPPRLFENDFVQSYDGNQGSIRLEISEDISNIVVLNKYLSRDCVSIYVPDKIKDNCIEKIIDILEWIANIKTELLDFYNSSTFDYRLENVDQEWFDGLEVANLFITINKDGTFLMDVTVYDYLQNDFGFILSIENKTIQSIEYDPIL